MKKSNSSLSGILALIIIIGAFYYSWKYTIPAYQKSQNDIVETQKEIDAGKSKLASLKTVQNDLDQLGTVTDKLFIAIPGDKDTPNLITELEATAAKYSIVLPSIQISDSISASGAQTTATAGNAVSVSFAVTGSFEDLNKFLTSLENSIRYSNVKTITFASADKEMSMAIQLEVYKRIDISASATGLGSLFP